MDGLEKSDVIFSDPFVLKIFYGEVVKVTGLDRGRGRKWMRQKAEEMGKYRWECSVLEAAVSNLDAVCRVKATCLK